jgi:multidrug efflux pump subunit AcrB
MAGHREQNLQVPAGQVGQPPATRGQSFQYSLRVRGRLVEAAEFADVIVGSKADGSFVRLKDIGQRQLGARSYSNVSTLDGKPRGRISVARWCPARMRWRQRTSSRQNSHVSKRLS